uniref:Uncharacterized protein n=1 Tax=Babesia bovis TaxID=5865 RepID=S6BA88_BABBO|nr:hypothetical protein [Babesia bovis]
MTTAQCVMRVLLRKMSYRYTVEDKKLMTLGKWRLLLVDMYRNKPSEPRPSAERPEPQNSGSNVHSPFGGVIFSVFAFPFSIIMPFSYGGNGMFGFSLMRNTGNLTPQQRRAHINSAALLIIGLMLIAYIVLIM